MFRVLTRVVADTLVIAMVLFVAAGTVAWQRAWVLVAVLLVVRVLSAIAVFRVNPALLSERSTVLIHRHQPGTDRLILLAFMGTAFVGVPVVAALDGFRWHVLPTHHHGCGVGLGLFVLGWTIIALALAANPFATTVVRLQGERQHRVVTTGIYGVVRHPMYAGSPLVNVGLSLWLGSYAGALFATIPLGLLVIRLAYEEQFLRRELPAYRDYAKRVPYRLVPGLW